MRHVFLVLVAPIVASCAHEAPHPAADVAACVIPRASLALYGGLVAPLLDGERAGDVVIDARGCGPGVLDPAEAQRISTAIAAAVPGLVALVHLSPDPCVDAWATVIGDVAASVGESLPRALSGDAPLHVGWAVPACKP